MQPAITLFEITRFAFPDQNGDLSLIGIVDGIGAQSLPLRIPSLFAVAKVSGFDPQKDVTNVYFGITQPDGRKLLEASSPITPRSDKEIGESVNPKKPVIISTEIGPLDFTQAGTHVFTLRLGEISASKNLEVIITPA